MRDNLTSTCQPRGEKKCLSRFWVQSPPKNAKRLLSPRVSQNADRSVRDESSPAVWRDEVGASLPTYPVQQHAFPTEHKPRSPVPRFQRSGALEISPAHAKRWCHVVGGDTAGQRRQIKVLALFFISELNPRISSRSMPRLGLPT